MDERRARAPFELQSINLLNRITMKDERIYQERKERAREIAIDWQDKTARKRLYMSELAEAGEYFYKLGRRYGLLKEFRENAIPC